MGYIALIDGNSMVRTIFEKKYRWFIDEKVDLKHFKLDKYIANFIDGQITGGYVRKAPESVCIVFDTNINYRKMVMPDYKGNRKATAVHKLLDEMTFEDFGKKGFTMKQLSQVKKDNEDMYNLMKQISDEIKADKTYKSKKLENSDEVNLKITNFVNLWNSVVEDINDMKIEKQEAHNEKGVFFNQVLAELKETLTTEGIKFIEKEGFEGDDLINSIIKQYPEHNYVVFSGDKDLNQLVSKTVARSTITVRQGLDGKVKTDIVTLKDVSENTLLEKVLCGDVSDNVPGVKGLGTKRGKELLKLGHNIDEILANDELNDKDRDLILESYRDLIIYEHIITLKNIPVSLELNTLEDIKKFIEIRQDSEAK